LLVIYGRVQNRPESRRHLADFLQFLGCEIVGYRFVGFGENVSVLVAYASHIDYYPGK
jgi:hypothetical protein